jgi:hypothetical protein
LSGFGHPYLVKGERSPGFHPPDKVGIEIEKGIVRISGEISRKLDIYPNANIDENKRFKTGKSSSSQAQ